MVLARKESNKWSICIDFTDLKVACPIDEYPIPQYRLSDWRIFILQNIELHGYMFKANQNKMNPKDVSKTTFMSNHGNSYYNDMPSSLLIESVGLAVLAYL